VDATTNPDDRPAKFYWLLPFLRPPVAMTRGQERTFLLVGVAALFGGYDMVIFGLATPQIQASLSIPENRLALTVTFFRLAAFGAILLAAMADLVGRRRLLLITITGQAIATLGTAFSGTYEQFVLWQVATRVFGYAEEMLCIVVIMEEMEASARGWAAGMFAAMTSTGAGVASLVFAFVSMLPFGWRAIYVIGAVPLFLVAIWRRRLPETKRFAAEDAVHSLESRVSQTFAMLRLLVSEYPGRVAAILLVVASAGFAFAPAAVLMSKYLQQVHHYSPGGVTALYVPGGFIALAISVLAGRFSDRIGRKVVVLTMAAFGAACFGLFYSGYGGWFVPVAWIAAMSGYFTMDALVAGFSSEIVPTAYRATVSGLRYTVGILSGAISLALEGVFYDHFGGHGPAVLVALATVPVLLIAVLLLPEPSGKTLEEMTETTAG
jgi:putative MFS transporter